MKNEDIIKSITKKYKKEIWSRFNKAIKEFKLIEENDKIMVCISGGKDSMLLAKCFEELKRHSYYHFDLEYVVMNPGYKQENLALLKSNLEKLNIKATIFDSDIFAVCDKLSKENPCYLCARMIRGWLYSKAKELGCNYLATGHYAKTEYSEEYKRWVLKKSNAGKKDQSYVLWNIPKDLIEHVLFPLADFKNKEEIREIARKNNLKVANKPDSEDICFVPDGNYKKFLENNSDIKPKPGNIVNTKGEILGRHNGLYNYTIGQRKGLGISYKVPLYVVGFNKEKNEVIVGEENEIYSKEMLVNNINLLLIDEIKEKMQVLVKTRYSVKEEKATIKMIDKDLIKVTFEKPTPRITPGQSAVFYIDDIVLGGGKIVKAL